MKETAGVDVLIRDLSTNPKCPHGPTILFAPRNGKKYFSCSSNRGQNCFYLELDAFERNREVIAPEIKPGYIQDSSELISHESVSEPSLFLKELATDTIFAQYFFDETTLKFISSVLSQLRIQKIICIGAPRLHDFIRSRPQFKMKSILLDIDCRFKKFYPDEFYYYNMFNNYFFEGERDEERFEKFLLDTADEKSNVMLITDPPFAGRSELLSQTIQSISHLYFKLNRKKLPVFWIFPYFNEKHIQREMSQMAMMDFKVTYVSHKAFKLQDKKKGSPIRIFTNIDQKLIKYPKEFTNYRYCKLCRRFVAKNNAHCSICKVCPSKNGVTYKHCKICIKCFKPNYSHCNNCDRCLDKNHHVCDIYQQHQECWFCNERGHVEKYCKLVNELKLKRVRGKCTVCKEKHNLSSCKAKFKYLEQ